MSVWLAKAMILASSLAMIVIRAPHGQRSLRVKVIKSRRGRLEAFLLTLAWVAFFVPIFWALSSFWGVSPILAEADYALRPVAFAAGVVALVAGLWLFARSHADLGTNWSLTLEVRENHRLVTDGVYQRVRHPMYLALIVYGIGQALVVPNWIAGPSYLVAMVLLFALRLGPEERLMEEEFGESYRDYVKRTKRLLPGVW